MRHIFVLATILGFSLAFPDANNNGEHVSNDPLVTLTIGQIQGTKLKSRLGKEVFSFRGIPYAKAPVEELRFKVSENKVY